MTLEIKIKSFFSLFFVLFLFNSLFFSSPASASDLKYGVFEQVKGRVHVINEERHQKTILVKEGMDVFLKDVVFSFQNSEAQIRLKDGSQILLVSNSKIQIGEKEENFLSHSEIKSSSSQSDKSVFNVPYYIELILGKVRVQFANEEKSSNKEKSRREDLEQHQDPRMRKYQVRTRSAVIGVRGTDFLATYKKSDQSTEVVSFDGEVLLYPMEKSTGQFLEPVSILAGEVFTHFFGKTIVPPNVLKREELIRLDQETKWEDLSSEVSVNNRQEFNVEEKYSSSPFGEKKNDISETSLFSSVSNLEAKDHFLSLSDDFNPSGEIFVTRDPFENLRPQGVERAFLDPYTVSDCLLFSCRTEEDHSESSTHPTHIFLRVIHE